jgi:TP901 family phage tail tape measure protein
LAVIRNLVVKIGADISGLSKGLKTAQTKLQKLSSSLTGIGTSLTMKVTMPLVMLAKQALKTSGEFEQSMANAASVSGATGEELQKMTDVAREMGKTTVFSASEAADAMYYMASAGYKAEQMAEAIQPILNLASATQNDLAYTTDTVIATLNQFQLESSEAERVSNVFAAAIGYSQATLEKLGNSMAYVGPVANSLGWSLEETTGALSVLYNAGYDGSMAGTSLRQSLVALMNPSTSAKKIFEELGLQLKDLDPTTNSFADIVDRLRESGLTTAQAMEVFGARAGPGMMALLAQGGDAIRENTEAITETNSATEMAAKQVNTMQGSAKLMKSMMEEVAISIGDILIPMMRELMEKYMMPLLEKFQGLATVSKELVVKIAMVAAAIGPAFLALGKIVKVGSKVVKLISMCASPIGLLIVAVIALGAAFLYLFKTNEDFRAKVLKLWNKVKSGIIKALSAIKAWWDTNGEMVLQSVKAVFQKMADVIVFVVGVIVSLVQKFVSSILYLWENNKEFRDAVVQIWNGIKQAIVSAISFIVAWWEANGARLWESVKTIFNTIWDVIVLVLDQIIKSVTVFLGYLTPIWEQVKSVFASLWNLMQELWVLLEPLLKVVGAALATLLGAAIGCFNGIIQALGPLIQASLDVLQIVIDVVGAIVCLLTGDLDGAWEHMKSAGDSVKSFFSHMWEAMKNFAKGFVDAFLGFFSSFGVDFVAEAKRICEVVGNWFTNLWSGIKNGAVNIWDAITGIFGKIGDWFSNLFKRAYDWGKNLIQCIVNGINDAIEWVGDSIKSVGQKIKDFLGFSSPTKKGPGHTADEWMPNMMDMFADGIKTNLPDIETAVDMTAMTLANLGGVNVPQKDEAGMLNSMLGAISMMQSTNRGSNEPVELSIDGQVFARVILPSLTKEFKRNGIVLEGI